MNRFQTAAELNVSLGLPSGPRKVFHLDDMTEAIDEAALWDVLHECGFVAVPFALATTGDRCRVLVLAQELNDQLNRATTP